MKISIRAEPINKLRCSIAWALHSCIRADYQCHHPHARSHSQADCSPLQMVLYRSRSPDRADWHHW